MEPFGRTASHFQQRFRARILETQAARIFRWHLSERLLGGCGRC